MEVCVCLHVGMYVYCLAGCLDGSWDIWVVLIGLGCLGRRARNQGRKTGSKQACKHEVQGKDTPTSAGESPARPDCKGNQGKDLAERSPTAEGTQIKETATCNKHSEHGSMHVSYESKGARGRGARKHRKSASALCTDDKKVKKAVAAVHGNI